MEIVVNQRTIHKKSRSHLLPLVVVDLFLVLPALGLAVGAVPVEQDGERDDEERVRHRDRRHDRKHDVVPVARRKKTVGHFCCLINSGLIVRPF